MVKLLDFMKNLTQYLLINHLKVNLYMISVTGRVLAMNDLLGYKIFKTNECEWSKYTLQAKSSIEEYSDAAIVVVTRMSGEGDDVSFAYSETKLKLYLSLMITLEKMKLF